MLGNLLLLVARTISERCLVCVMFEQSSLTKDNDSACRVTRNLRLRQKRMVDFGTLLPISRTHLCDALAHIRYGSGGQQPGTRDVALCTDAGVVIVVKEKLGLAWM